MLELTVIWEEGMEDANKKEYAKYPELMKK